MTLSDWFHRLAQQGKTREQARELPDPRRRPSAATDLAGAAHFGSRMPKP